MSKKHHGGPGPVPPANRQSHFGGAVKSDEDAEEPTNDGKDESGFQNEDPQRRLGGFTGAGEHAVQQPGPLNDGTRRG